LLKSKKESEKIYKSYKIYKEKYQRLSYEFGNYKKNAEMMENNSLRNLEIVKRLLEDNEELKRTLELTNSRMSDLADQVEFLSRNNERANINVDQINAYRQPPGNQFFNHRANEIVNYVRL
jgi:hypothetical protein